MFKTPQYGANSRRAVWFMRERYMMIKFHTPYGVFISKEIKCNEEEAAAVKTFLQDSAKNGDFLDFETENGYIVLATDVLKNCVFEVEN
jgi:hypothetical protein